jgi:hypothetical protein
MRIENMATAPAMPGSPVPAAAMATATTTPVPASAAPTARMRRRRRPASASPSSRLAARYAHGPTTSPTTTRTMTTSTGRGGGEVCSTSHRKAAKTPMPAQPSSTTQPDRSREPARWGGSVGRSRALPAEDVWRFTTRS